MPFSVYKPGQGRIARVSTGIAIVLLSAYGVSSLGVALRDAGTLFSIGTQQFTWGQVVPLVVFLGIVALVLWGLNFPRFADFLIETEIEMGRVIWPTRRSVIASSAVVIITMVAMSLLLYGVDSAIFGLLKVIGLY